MGRSMMWCCRRGRGCIDEEEGALGALGAGMVVVRATGRMAGYDYVAQRTVSGRNFRDGCFGCGTEGVPMTVLQ